MNTDRLLTAGIALCCIFAIGSTASTLGSSVSTNPDEVINVDYESLPINPDDAGELKKEAQSDRSEQASKSSGRTNQQEQQQQQQQHQQQQRDRNQQQQNGGSSASMGPPDLLDRLLEFLRWLLAQLLWLVPLVALVGGVALGVRFRDRLFDAGSSSGGDGGVTTVPPDPEPSNEIERAWWSMVEHVGVDGAHTKTPGECADEAVAAGADPDAVESLTRTFEEVRYGGAPVTEDRAARARRGVEGVVGR